MGESGDSGDWGKSLYVAKIENLMEHRRIREIGSLGDSGDWEIPEIGEIREIGENHYMWQKLRTSWNPGGFERLGVWEIREIGRFGRFGTFWKLGEIIICGKN